MPIFVYSERRFTGTCWRNMKYRSIAEEAAKKRIRCYQICSRAELESYRDEYRAEFSTLILIPGMIAEIDRFLQEFDGVEPHIVIFAHHERDVLDSDFSYIMSDQPGAMRDAVAHLRGKGCRRLALYAVTPGSNHDHFRMESFRRFSGMEKPRIFLKEGPTQACVRQLLSSDEPIDALLCANDFQALSLMPVLSALDPDWNRKLLLLSFSDLMIGAVHSPSLTSLSLGFQEGGKEIVALHRALSKTPEIAYMHILMHSTLAARDTTAAQDPSGICFADLPRISDADLTALLAPKKYLMQIENLLNWCDLTDLELVELLILGEKRSEIAERLFLSTDGVKYRIRKLKRYFRTETTEETVTLLKTWISPERLEERIRMEKQDGFRRLGTDVCQTAGADWGKDAGTPDIV